MKIVFIQVSISGSLSTDAMEPLAFAVLKGLTPKNHEIIFYDDRVEHVPLKLDCDLVAISVETYSAKRAYKLATIYRNQNIKVILGGYHPTFMPEEALEYADCIIIGEAENLWANVLDDFKNGALKTIYESNEKPDISNVYYDESVYIGKRYNKITPVQYSRGCKFSCEFCSSNAFHGIGVRYRKIDCVINEIFRRNLKFVVFVDDNFFCNRENTVKLLKALIPLKIKWVCQISLDITSDDEVLKLMVQSGCIAVLVGFESLNNANLMQMKKVANIAHNDYYAAVKKLYYYGIMIYGAFILGYDMDTEDTFNECLEFASKNNLLLANFNPLMVMPGTKLYARLKSEGRMIYDKWWLEPDFHYGDAMFIPKNMTPQQLRDGCYRNRILYNTYKNIFKRCLMNRINIKHLEIFLAANLINRRELTNKQGRFL